MAASSKGILAEPRKVIAACIFPLGAGSILSFYLAGVGFFVVAFESRNILLWMLLSVYSPFPIALYCQGKLDAYFDKLHTTRVTFFFRVIIIPLLMAGMIGVVASLCTMWIPVLVCGVIIGFLYAANVGSSLQMTSAWDPLLVVWAQIGNTLGATTSCLAFFIFSFSAAKASKIEFQLILTVPICICILTSAMLTYWHFKYDLFEHVYRRLSYDLGLAEEVSNEPERTSEFPPSMLPLTRGTSAEAPVYYGEVDEVGVPLFVPWYNFAGALNTFMTFMLLPFATYFGDADLAQTLVLAKFAMDFMGRFVALAWGYFYEGLQEPIHAEVIGQLIARLAAGIVCALSLFKVLILHHMVFLTVWCLFYADGSFLNSQMDLISTRCTVVGQRKANSRTNAFLGYVGLFAALWLSLAVVYFSGAGKV